MVGRILQPSASCCQAAREAVCSEADICVPPGFQFPGKRGKKPTFSAVSLLAAFLPFHAAMNWEIAFGRWLALCAHPICAWRVRSKTARALVVTSYFAAGYMAALLVLMMRD
jgi:hypothetical protein